MTGRRDGIKDEWSRSTEGRGQTPGTTGKGRRRQWCRDAVGKGRRRQWCVEG